MGEIEEGKEGYIYFIEKHDAAFVKIGYSIDVPQRLSAISLLLPGLRLVAHMPGTYATESTLHRRLSMHHENGEWFRNVDEIRAFIAAEALRCEPETEQGNRKRLAKKLPRVVTVDVTEAGRKGGKARAKNMSKAERSEAARPAVLARWVKAREKRAGSEEKKR